MSSLKSYITTLAPMVGLTSAALYERQRALVRVGLLQVEAGKGPGSGVKATPRSVAMLLLSVLAADNLSDVPSKTSAIARSRCRDSELCPVSGAITLVEALTWALESEKNADKLQGVKVCHDWEHATLSYMPRLRYKFVDFGEREPSTRRPIQVEAHLHDARILKKIASDLKHAAKEEGAS